MLYKELEGGDLMEVNWMELISSVGFPIVCCVYLIYNQNKMNDRHTQEVDKLRQSLDNNTKVMNKILRRLKIDEDEEDDI